MTDGFRLRCPDWRRERSRLKGRVDAVRNDEIVYSDVIMLDSADDRRGYADAVIEHLDGEAPSSKEIEARLLKLVEQSEAEGKKTSPSADAEKTADGRLTRAGDYCRKPTEAGGRMLARFKGSEAGEIVVPMATFDAWIVEEIVRDDESGVPQIDWVIAGSDGRGRQLPTVTIPAQGLSSLEWVTSSWGTRAVILAGQKEHLKVALQLLSGEPQRRTVYTHTGWRQIDGKWAFLHGGGAIGADGQLIGVEVGLPEKLARYSLPEPKQDVASDLKVLLDTLNITDRRVTMPLVITILSAALDSIAGHIPSLIVLGETGRHKSTIIALFLHLVGGPFSAQTPVTTWEDTANALEKLAFSAKDIPLWVDDIRPPTTRREREQQQAAIQRLLRGVITRSGRGRLRNDLRDAQVYHPRGPVITSAELLPDNSSTLARALVVRMAGVDLKKLTEAQRVAPEAFARVGAAWVQFLAKERDRLGPMVREAARRQRDVIIARYPALHGGIADSVGRLIAVAGVFLTWAATTGAISREEAETLKSELTEALIQVALDTAEAVGQARPSVSFIEGMKALLATGRAVLGGIADGKTLPKPLEHATAFGWRLQAIEGQEQLVAPPGAVTIGWYDQSDKVVYLNPTVAFREVTVYSRELREGVPFNQEQVYRELTNRGLLARTDKTQHTVPKRIDGRVTRVLAIKAEVLLGDEGDTGEANKEQSQLECQGDKQQLQQLQTTDV